MHHERLGRQTNTRDVNFASQVEKDAHGTRPRQEQQIVLEHEERERKEDESDTSGQGAQEYEILISLWQSSAHKKWRADVLTNCKMQLKFRARKYQDVYAGVFDAYNGAAQRARS